MFIAPIVESREWNSDTALPLSHRVTDCATTYSQTDTFEDPHAYVTQLMPYTDIGRSGYVYGFTFCSVAAADDVRVEIWR